MTLGQRVWGRPDAPVTSCRSLTHLKPHSTHLCSDKGDIHRPELSDGVDGVMHRKWQVLDLASIQSIISTGSSYDLRRSLDFILLLL